MSRCISDLDPEDRVNAGLGLAQPDTVMQLLFYMAKPVACLCRN